VQHEIRFTVRLFGMPIALADMKSDAAVSQSDWAVDRDTSAPSFIAEAPANENPPLFSPMCMITIATAKGSRSDIRLDSGS
jgi:hypothetical protein